MPDWHGYPQGPDAHPDRPWWRQHSWTLWRRSDGVTWSGYCRDDVRDEHLAILDREQPIPAPPPMAGQVWRCPDGATRTIGAHREADRRWWWTGLETGHGWQQWPPPGAVLVAGVGAPWAPMEAE
jgi:hypothetical protein